jgi:hypothetical protein
VIVPTRGHRTAHQMRSSADGPLPRASSG